MSEFESELEFKILDKNWTTSVSQLLTDSFFKDEPLGIALDCPITQVTRWLPAYVESILMESVTLGVFENNSLIGVCVNIIENYQPLTSCINQETEPTMYEVARFLQQLNEGFNARTELDLPPDSKILSTLFLNVNQSHAGKGIATKLAIKTENLSRNLGVAAVQVDCTSEFSFRIYSKLGYTTLRQLEYSELKNPMTGVQVIHPEKIGPLHKRGSLVAKIITSLLDT